MKESTHIKIVQDVIGSAMHEGMEDPYNFYYEVLYRYEREITKEEYFRLCEEYHAALDHIEGKPHEVIVKAWAEYPLKTPRAREMYHRWFEIKFPKLYKA